MPLFLNLEREYVLQITDKHLYTMSNVIFISGETGSVTVVPRCCKLMGPGSIPSPGAERAFGFQSMLPQIFPESFDFPSSI